jgi:uncharacterized protein
MAGLLDIYTLAGVGQALDLVVSMASYFRLRIENVIAQGTVALWHAIMNQEFGGMNRVLYDLCAITGNATHCDTAHLFDKPCFLGPLALGADQLDGQHANAHIPIAIGAARHYEVEGAGSELYADIASALLLPLPLPVLPVPFAPSPTTHGSVWMRALSWPGARLRMSSRQACIASSAMMSRS